MAMAIATATAMAIGSPPPEGGERLRGGDTAKQWTTTRIKTASELGVPCSCLETARVALGAYNPRGKRRVGGAPSLASQGGSLLDTNSSTDFVRSASFVSSSVGRPPCAAKEHDARARVEEQRCQRSGGRMPPALRSTSGPGHNPHPTTHTPQPTPHNPQPTTHNPTTEPEEAQRARRSHTMGT